MSLRPISRDSLAGLLRDSGEIYLVAVAGIPGSGKSTLARQLADEIPGAVVLPMDGYHLPRSRLDGDQMARRGAPDTFEPARFRRDLERLRARRKGSFPGFDHERADPEPGALEVTTRDRPVIVEGLYLLLQDWDLADLFDLTIWLECGIETALERVARRHLDAGICRSLDVARNRAETNDRRNAERILGDGCRERADRILSQEEAFPGKR